MDVHDEYVTAQYSVLKEYKYYQYREEQRHSQEDMCFTENKSEAWDEGRSLGSSKMDMMV